MSIDRMTLIYTTTLTSDSSGITINNIPQGFTDLYMEMTTKDTGGYVRLRLNGDSGSTNYQRVNFYGMARNNADTASNIVESGRGTNESGMFLVAGDNEFAMNWYYLLGYSSPNVKKVLLEDNSFVKPLGGAIGQYNYLWKNASPVTSLVFDSSGSSTWKTGSTINIYGIECAKSPKADGGIITRDGTYYYHTFLSSGTFTPKQSLTVDYLVVAGGGSGGNVANGAGGGGGAGGLRCTVGSTGGGGSLPSVLSLTANAAYTITVGSGGTVRANGNNSSISGTGITTVTSTGGGQGGSRSVSGAINGATGGSGGGGSGEDSGSTGGSGTANEGYAGGTGGGSNVNAGGGGGGAGAAGSARAAGTGTITGGDGGAGVTTSISGISLTYAGGGGGGSTINGGVSNGGSGGGGKGGGLANSYIATSGIANTGGGGGGGGNGTGRASGNGGSGIVIVRYAI